MLKVGIIGMGYGAQVHLPVYDNIPELNVTCLADGGSGKASKLCAEREELKAFSNGFDLITYGDVDLVSIATPPQFHFELVRQALLAGKHVFCEKPFCVSLDQVRQLAALEQESAGSVCVGYEFPYDQAFSQLIETSQKNEIGTVQRVNVSWLTSGGLANRPDSWKTSGEKGSGLLYDWCCHVLDYAHLITAQEYEWLWCKRHGEKDVDIACGFRGGVTGQFHISSIYQAHLGHFVDVIADQGGVSLSHMPPFSKDEKKLVLKTKPDLRGQLLESVHALEDVYPDNRMAAMHQLVCGFLDGIEQGSQSSYVGINRAERVWRLLEALEKSAATGEVVTFL